MKPRILLHEYESRDADATKRWYVRCGDPPGVDAGRLRAVRWVPALGPQAQTGVEFPNVLLSDPTERRVSVW